MSEVYYREKIISLTDKLFVETGDARSRIINCQDKLQSAFYASTSEFVPLSIQLKWKNFYKELNSEEFWQTDDGAIIQTSLTASVLRKRNKSLEKYLHFILEEFYRVFPYSS